MFILVLGFLLGAGCEVCGGGTFRGSFAVGGHGEGLVEALGVWYCDGCFGAEC